LPTAPLKATDLHNIVRELTIPILTMEHFKPKNRYVEKEQTNLYKVVWQF
jgi:hypothetical protein